jgi:N-methylhydantoinase A
MYGRFADLQASELEELFADQQRALLADLGASAGNGVETQRFLDLRYVGQGTELTIALPEGRIGEPALATTRARFDEEHQRTYRHRSDVDLEVVAMRMTATRVGNMPIAHAQRSAADNGARGTVSSSRRVYFGTAGHVETPVVARWQLGHEPVDGPVIVEEYDATIVVPPDAIAQVDDHGNLVVDLSRRTRP